MIFTLFCVPMHLEAIFPADRISWSLVHTKPCPIVIRTALKLLSVIKNWRWKKQTKQISYRIWWWNFSQHSLQWTCQSHIKGDSREEKYSICGNIPLVWWNILQLLSSWAFQEKEKKKHWIKNKHGTLVIFSSYQPKIMLYSLIPNDTHK